MDASRRDAVLARALSLAATMAAAFVAVLILLAAFSSDFAGSSILFFLGPFKNAYYFGNMLNAAIALVLAGLGASVAFASRNFNLGGEGQVYLGAIAATVACLAAEGLPRPAGMALGLAAGAATGSALGYLSGALKRYLGVDELLSSFLASGAVVFVGDFLITGPLQDRSSNFQTTLAIPQAFRFARIYPPSSLSSAFALAILAALALRLVLARTRFGFELRMSGMNREFARYAGIDTGFYSTAPMALSGALHGLAGALLVTGTYFRAMKGFTVGVGWSGIAVALIAGSGPLAVLPAALFFAYLEAGAKAVMVGADVSSEIVAVAQAVVFFLVTARAFEGLASARLGSRRARRGGGLGGGEGP